MSARERACSDLPGRPNLVCCSTSGTTRPKCAGRVPNRGESGCETGVRRIECGGFDGWTMRAPSKRWALVAGIVVILVVVLLATCHRAPKAPGAVTITFVGYTNAPNKNARFALFAVTNLAGHDIRFWDDWVTVEGDSQEREAMHDLALPGFKEHYALRDGGSLMLAVRYSFHPPEIRRWRYSMSFARYSLGARWLDFSERHKLPRSVGPITLVDYQRTADPTNQVVVSSDWLTN